MSTVPPASPDPQALRPRLWRLAAQARPALTAILALAVLALAWTATRRLAAEVSYDDLVAAIAATPAWALAAALALTALGFAALVAYDLGALAHVGRNLPLPLVALASFCAYAVGNTAGFGPLTAGAIRYRFYAPRGLEPEQVARVVAFVTIAFGLGLTVVTAVALVAAADDIPAIGASPLALRLIGAAILAGALALAAAAGRSVRLGRWTLRLPGLLAMARQLAATAIDVLAAAAVLWVLLPAGTIGLAPLVAVYAVAIGLGVLSHVPAGLGVFETIIVAALSGRAEVDAILGALLLYRLVYHLVPLALAVVVIAVLEGRRAAEQPAVASALRAGARLAPPVIGAFTLVLAGMLILSGVIPIADGPLTLLAGRLPLPVVEGAHFIGSVLGVLLLPVARGLVYRLDGAWWAAVVLVPVSILLSLLKAAAIGEAGLLALLLVVLVAARHEFTRHASLLHQTLTANWLMAVSCLLITAIAVLFFVYQDVDYSNELWWQFEFSQHAPRSLRALMGILLTAGFGAAWLLLRPALIRPHAASADQLAQAMAITRAQERAEAGLVAMGDKSLLFSADGRAFIMFGRQGRSWVALGDPVGPRECWPALIWRFLETARAGGGRAAFYQVGADTLALYADAGLRAFKLGEEARVDLGAFSLKGAKRANMRNQVNRAERDGQTFHLLDHEQTLASMAALQAISDGWMAQHNVREKGFSLGAFRPDYVASQRVAVLKDQGRMVAFVTLMATDSRHDLALDLMRFAPDAPKGAMDVLLLKLMEWARDEGYGWLSLGMAPLAGLPGGEVAPLWYRVGRMVFDHGEWFYNFTGLRAFKSKFQPEWRPRYLAVGGGVNPMLALADVTVLISGGLKGLIGK